MTISRGLLRDCYNRWIVCSTTKYISSSSIKCDTAATPSPSPLLLWSSCLCYFLVDVFRFGLVTTAAEGGAQLEVTIKLIVDLLNYLYYWRGEVPQYLMCRLSRSPGRCDEAVWRVSRVTCPVWRVSRDLCLALLHILLAASLAPWPLRRQPLVTSPMSGDPISIPVLAPWPLRWPPLVTRPMSLCRRTIWLRPSPRTCEQSQFWHRYGKASLKNTFFSTNMSKLGEGV